MFDHHAAMLAAKRAFDARTKIESATVSQVDSNGQLSATGGGRLQPQEGISNLLQLQPGDRLIQFTSTMYGLPAPFARNPWIIG